MRVAVEKVEGVSDAAVSLNDGEVVITFESPNDVTLDELREIIRDQGFTPREADVRVKGVAERRNDTWSFLPTGADTPWEVHGAAAVLRELEARAGEPVVVRGRVEEKTPRRLRVTSVGGSPGG